jgi:hypothetical protein
VMRAAGDTPDGLRLRGLVVVLWRAGLRISEALGLTESDLAAVRGAILVRRGKGGKRREVGMDRCAWEQLSPWLRTRASLPVGALFCVLRAPARGRRVQPPASAPSSAGLASRAASDGDSPHISFVTRTPSRCRGRASPWSSSSANSDTRTLGSRLRICAESIRDHPHRPRAARADDPSDERTPHLELDTRAGARRWSGSTAYKRGAP